MGKHPPEVKEEARRRVAEGEAVTAVARSLGLPHATVQYWLAASAHAKPRGARDERGRWLKGTSPNPSGVSSNLERARLKLEDAAPANVERLLSHVKDLEKCKGLDLSEMFRSKELVGALNITLKPLYRAIEARAQAEAQRLALEAERLRLEQEEAARLDLSALTDDEAETLEGLLAKARRK